MKYIQIKTQAGLERHLAGKYLVDGEVKLPDGITEYVLLTEDDLAKQLEQESEGKVADIVKGKVVYSDRVLTDEEIKVREASEKLNTWDSATEKIFAENQALAVEFVEHLSHLRTLRKEYRSPQLYIAYLSKIKGVSVEAKKVVTQLIEASKKAV